MNQSGNQPLCSLNLSQSVNPQLLSVLPTPIVSISHTNPSISLTKPPANSTEQHMNQPNRVSNFQISHNYTNWRPQIPSFPNSCAVLPTGNWRDNKKTSAGRRSEILTPSAGGVLNSAPYRIDGRSRRSSGGYKTRSLHKLQSQNSFKTNHKRRKFHKKFVPLAPRNTSSFIIRAKKSGGIAPLISPYPVTPAVLPTPIFSPSKELLVDMAKEEWGVDGYGSMKGLIRLRYPGHDADGFDEEDDDEEGEGEEGDGVCSSESDVEEHVEVERRLDQDLSRFEMVYPNYDIEYDNVTENIMDDQTTHVEQLEVENMRLKERIVLMTKDLSNLTQRLHLLEGQNLTVVDNCSDNDSCHREEDDLQTVV